MSNSTLPATATKAMVAAAASCLETLDHQELANPATDLGLPDFRDPRVFAVPASFSNRHVAQVYAPDSFDHGQPHDGPSYIFVGSAVNDERLARHLPMLNKRYGVSMRQLQAARAGGVVPVRVDPPENWVEPRQCITAAEAM